MCKSAATFGRLRPQETEMGSLSIWHWLIVLVVVLILFGGRGKIPELMGDFAKGIKNFKKGMSDDEETPPKPVENKTDDSPRV